MFGANNRPSLFGTQNSSTSAFGTPGFGTAAATGNTFGGLQPQQTQPSLFGSTNTGFGASTGSGLFGTQTSLFGTTPAVQQTTGFSATTPGSSNAFGSTTGLFGSTNTNNQSIFGANKFGSTVSPFGTTTQAAAPVGTTVKFNPLIGSDTMLKNGVNTNISTRHQCITCMKEYETKSLEELRLEDYQANRKGPGTSGNMFGTQGTSLFSSNPSSLSFNTSTNNSIFGANKPAFGATTTASNTSIFNSSFNKPTTGTGTTFGGFGQPQPQPQQQQQTPIFGQPTSTFTSQPSFFQGTQNATTPLKPLFGTSTQQTSLFTNTSTNSALGAKPLFGATSATPFGTGTSSGFSLNPTTTTSLFASPSMFNTATNTSTANKTPMFNFPSQPLTQPTNTMGTGTSGSLFNTGNNIFGQSNSMFNPGTNVGTSLFSGTSIQPVQNQIPAMSLQQLTASAQPSNTELLLNRLQTLPYGDSPLFQNSTKSSSPSLKFTTDPKTLHQYKVNFTSAANQKLSRTPNPVSKSTSLLFDGLEEENQFERKSNFDIFVPRRNIKKLTLKSKDDKSRNDSQTSVNDTMPFALQSTKSPQSVSKDSQEPSQRRSLEAAVETTIQDLISSPRNTNVNTQTKVMSVSADENSGNSFSGRSFLAGDESYVVTSDSAPKLKCGVILNKPEYYTIPPLEQLDSFYDSSTNTCVLASFTVGRHGYGSVYWDGPIDVQGLNLDMIVHFRRKEVIVYPDDNEKVPEGEGLNRPAQITLHQVWPIDKTTHEIIKDVERLRAMKYSEKIENATVKLGATFKEYRPETGSWVFTVKHFSKYGLADESDEEHDTEENVTSSRGNTGTSDIISYDTSRGSTGEAHRVFENVPQRSNLPRFSESGLQQMEFNETITNNTRSGKPRFVTEDENNTRLSADVHTVPDFREQLKNMDSNQIIDPDMLGAPQPIRYSLAKFESRLQSDLDFQPKEEPLFQSFLTDKHSAMRSVMFDDMQDDLEYSTADHYHKKPKKLLPFYEEPLQEPSVVIEKPRVVLKRELTLLVDTFAAKNKISCDINAFVPAVCRVAFFNGSNNFVTISGSKIKINALDLIPACCEHADRFETHCKELSLITAQTIPFIQTKKFASNPFNILRLEKFVKACYTDLKHLDNYSKEQQRLNNIIDWLCEQTKAIKKPDESLKAILFDLAANNIKSAVETAIAQRFFKLSLIISAGGSTAVKDSLIYQLDSWKKSGADQFIAKDLLKLYVVLSGGIIWYLSNGTCINVLEGLNWLQQLSLMLLFMSHKGLLDCIENMTAETNDVEYHLLAEHSPWVALSSCKNDLEAWFLHQALESCGVISITDPMSDVIHGIVVARLMSKDIKWACFVACHIRDDNLREYVVAELIHYAAQSLNVDDESWLVNSLMLSPENIAMSKAVYSRKCFDFSKTALYLVHSGRWQEAHDILIEHIFPELVINDETDVLHELLENLKPHKDEIRNWHSNGAHIYDVYCNIVQGKNLDENLLSSFNIHMMSCSSNRHVLCQSEMARKVGLIHVGLTGGTFAVNTPMPDDYVFQEMRHNCKALLSQLCS